MKKLFPLSFLILALLHYSNSSAQSILKDGTWNCVLNLTTDAQLPFKLTVTDSSGIKKLFIVNGIEKIPVHSYREKGDSVFIIPSVFQTEIRAKLISDNGNQYLQGMFIDYARKGDYRIPFSANNLPDIQEATNSSNFFTGKWEVHFSPGTEDSSSAIGIFNQKENNITGTFLTTTGDYRYLSGRTFTDQMILSAFDGAHLFLFSAQKQNDGTIKGEFWSGRHSHENWIAKRNDNFQLPEADKLTYLKDGFNSISFSFPDADSNIISMSDARFKNTVTLVQVTGSWCPNCMDETRVLVPLYNSNHSKGLEVVALDFERKNDWSYIQKSLRHEKEVFNISYPVLFAGLTTNSSASLPMLNKIMGYPTLIIIDKKGVVRKIITGIDGPATGDSYEKWKDDLTGFVQKLLEE